MNAWMYHHVSDDECLLKKRTFKIKRRWRRQIVQMGKACVFHIRQLEKAFLRWELLSKGLNEAADESVSSGGRVPQAERMAETETCSMARGQECHEWGEEQWGDKELGGKQRPGRKSRLRSLGRVLRGMESRWWIWTGTQLIQFAFLRDDYGCGLRINFKRSRSEARRTCEIFSMWETKISWPFWYRKIATGARLGAGNFRGSCLNVACVKGR